MVQLDSHPQGASRHASIGSAQRRLLSMTDLANMVDAALPNPGKRGPYKEAGCLMGETRNFECVATGKPCADPRCDKRFCVLDYQEPTHRPRIAQTRLDEIRAEAERVARDWFRWRGKGLTPALLASAVQRPFIIKEAKRRISVMSGWTYGRISN